MWGEHGLRHAAPGRKFLPNGRGAGWTKDAFPLSPVDSCTSHASGPGFFVRHRAFARGDINHFSTHLIYKYYIFKTVCKFLHCKNTHDSYFSAEASYFSIAFLQVRAKTRIFLHCKTHMIQQITSLFSFESLVPQTARNFRPTVGHDRLSSVNNGVRAHGPKWLREKTWFLQVFDGGSSVASQAFWLKRFL